MSALSTADPVEQLYRATVVPRTLVVPSLPFLRIDGHGDPNTTPAYAEAIQALYAVSYAAKFALKKATGQSPKVGPLECLWWAEDLTTFQNGSKDSWSWTALIRQPGLLTEQLVSRLVAEAAARKPRGSLDRLRLWVFEEGLSAQLLHIGPYSTEGPTIERLHRFIHDQGGAFDGHRQKHHEIYLGDPRRASPSRLRTIIRQPFSGSAPLAAGG